MTVQNWYIMGVTGFFLAGLFFIATVFLFVRLNIPSIIGNLTGRTEAKQIARFRQSNAASEWKGHNSTPSKPEKRKIEIPIVRSKSPATAEQTAVLVEEEIYMTTVLNVTSVLTPTGELAEKRQATEMLKLKPVKTLTVVHTEETI